MDTYAQVKKLSTWFLLPQKFTECDHIHGIFHQVELHIFFSDITVAYIYRYRYTISVNFIKIRVICIKKWAMPIEEVVILYCYLDQRRVTVNSVTDSNNYNALKMIIFLCSRSLPSLHKPEWSQSKQKLQNAGIWTIFLWQTTLWGMVSFCGSCRNKNANNTCASIQMWYSLVRLVEWYSSYSGRWWSLREGLL